jgi:hypothetical protein
MRIGIDLDDTLCTGTLPWPKFLNDDLITEFYETCTPIPEAVEKVRKLKEEGHYIIIHTSRWYQDEGVTLQWLSKHNVPFDKLSMVKERCDLYIDNQSATMEEVLKDDSVIQRGTRFMDRLPLSEKT